MNYEEKEELEYRFQKVVDYLKDLVIGEDGKNYVFILAAGEITEDEEGFICDRVAELHVPEGMHLVLSHMLAEILSNTDNENGGGDKILQVAADFVKNGYEPEEYNEFEEEEQASEESGEGSTQDVEGDIEEVSDEQAS